MMAVRLRSVFILVMLFGVLAIPGTKIASARDASAEEAQYMGGALALVGILGPSSERFLSLTEQPQFDDLDWQSELFAESVLWNAVYEAGDTLSPPSSLEAFDTHLQAAFDSIDDAGRVIDRAKLDVDAGDLEKTAGLLQASTASINEAIAVLPELTITGASEIDTPAPTATAEPTKQPTKEPTPTEAASDFETILEAGTGVPLEAVGPFSLPAGRYEVTYICAFGMGIAVIDNGTRPIANLVSSKTQPTSEIINLSSATEISFRTSCKDSWTISIAAV